MSNAKLYVLAAPSGAGKTTLVKALVTRNPELRFSISYTTRKKRSNRIARGNAPGLGAGRVVQRHR